MRKQNHISVPEGYFETLQERLLTIPGRSKAKTARYAAPCIAIAASFLAVVAAGAFLLQKTAERVPLSSEEIASYLIASGTSVEHLAYLHDEEND